MFYLVIIAGIALCNTSVVFSAVPEFVAENNATNHIPFDLACPDGVTLDNHATECTFASSFPLGGPLRLNGGTLHLDSQTNQVNCAHSMSIASAGTIDGHHNTMVLPRRSGVWMAPQMLNYAGMEVEPPFMLDTKIGGIDWHGRDDRPLFALTQRKEGGDLAIFKAQGHTLVSEAVGTLPAGGRQVKWCPNGNHGVITFAAPVNGSTLHRFIYDKELGTITTAPLGSHQGEITAISWEKHGERLAIGEYNHDALANEKVILTVYQRSDDVLAHVDRDSLVGEVVATESSYHAHGLIYSCAWRDRSALMVGRSNHPSEPQVMAYRVEEHDMHIANAFRTDCDVSTVAFLPQSEICLVGLVGRAELPRLLSCMVANSAGDAFDLTTMQYPTFTEDIFELAFSPDGLFLAVETYRGTQRDGSGTITVYETRLDGQLNLHVDKRNMFPHTDLCQVLSWAPHDSMLSALDIEGNLLRLSISRGLTLKDISLVANSPLHWRGGLTVDGVVTVDGQEYGWQIPLHSRWHLRSGSSLAVRNEVLELMGDLTLCGPQDSSCSFKNCRISRGEMVCHVPTTFEGRTNMQGVLDGTVTFADGSNVTLTGDTVWRGAVRIEGIVVVNGNGQNIDLRDARIEVAEGGQLAFYHTHVHDLHEVDMVSTSMMRFADGSLSLAITGAYEQGQVQIINCPVSYQSQTRRVTSVTYVGGSDGSLWERIRINGAAPDMGSSAGGDTGSAPPPASDGPIIVTTDEYVLMHDLYVTAESPLQVNATTVIRGNGHAIRCARGTEAVITVAGGQTLVVENARVEELSPRSIVGPMSSRVVWGRDTTVNVHESAPLAIAWHCRHNAKIEGNLHEITLDDHNTFTIEAPSDVWLQRLSISGIQGKRLAMMGRESIVHLNQVNFHLVGDAQLTQGAWYVRGVCGIHGWHTVQYASTMPITVHDGATFGLHSGAKLLYEPANGSARGIVLSPNATFLLDNSELASNAPALNVQDGRMVLRGHVTLRQAEGGQMLFGNQESGAHVKLVPEPGSFVHVYGHISMTLANE